MSPILRELEQRGMQITYVTALNSGSFEIGLREEGLNYRMTYDYLDGEVAKKIEKAYLESRGLLEPKMLHDKVWQYTNLYTMDIAIRDMIENFFLFDKILAVEGADVVFVLHELNFWTKMLAYRSSARKIPVVSFQEGMYPDSPYFSEIAGLLCDYSSAVLLWGNHACQLFKRAGVPEEKLRIVGSCHADQIVKMDRSERRRGELYKALQIRGDKKIILLIVPYMANSSSDVLAEIDPLLHWLKDKKDFCLVLKFHPTEIACRIGEIAEYVRGRISDAVVLQHFDPYRIVCFSEACFIIGSSTLGAEVLLLGKPLAELNFRQRDYPNSYGKRGVAIQIARSDDFLKCENILRKGIPEELNARISNYVNEIFYKPDGRTIERNIETISDMLARK
ncbi:MAG: hypothetical protein NTZ78_11755 [Candidatus Aureabacteria bacterium]|nr:hypothetical protein [Candidatus Auribacterota bacterium]